MKMKDLLPKSLLEAKERPATLAAVNREIKFGLGKDIELFKGNGYFYFMGKDVPTYAYSMSVMVNSIKSFTLEGWIKELESLLKDAEKRK